MVQTELSHLTSTHDWSFAPAQERAIRSIPIDTGAGSGLGTLTVADMDSKTFWQA